MAFVEELTVFLTIEKMEMAQDARKQVLRRSLEEGKTLQLPCSENDNIESAPALVKRNKRASDSA